MKRSDRTDKVCIEKILGYIEDIRECFEYHNINNHEDLGNKKLAHYAITQILTNIHELKKSLTENTLLKVTAFDKIKLTTARNIASHDYDAINFKMIHDICKKKLLNETTIKELEGAVSDVNDNK